MSIARSALFLSLALALAGCDRAAAPDAAPAAPAEPVPPTTVEPAPTAPVDPAGGTFPAAAASASLGAADGRGVGGQLNFAVADGGIRLTGTLTGLAVGASHALHVHENGVCEPPTFESAGAHFNPDGAPHGDAGGGDPHHAGDLPNQTVGADGRASVDVLLTGVELGGGGVRDIAGKAIVVHAQADDYATQPGGDAGDRIACGVITLTQAPPPLDVGPADERPTGDR